MKKILNYAGQMRVYGIIDILIFAVALGCGRKALFGVPMLWVSFLLYLEAKHQDKLRLLVSRFAWIIVGFPTLILLPPWLPFAFAVFAFMYTKKKTNHFFGYTSPIWRGLQNALIAYVFMPKFALLAFVAYSIRNLVGDLRDIGDDCENGTKTLPMLIGFRKNQSWAFFGHLGCVIGTTLIWHHFTNLSWGLIILCILIQVISYPITPRTSNPNYFKFQ